MLQVPVSPQVMRILEEPPSKLVRPPRPGGEQEVSKPTGGPAPRTRERGGPEAVRGHIATNRVAPPEAGALGPAGMALSLLGIMAGDLRELPLDSGNHVGEHGIQVVGTGSHDLHSAPTGTATVARGPHGAPGATQERPGGVQSGPRALPKGSQGAPRGLRGPQGGPRETTPTMGTLPAPKVPIVRAAHPRFQRRPGTPQ